MAKKNNYDHYKSVPDPAEKVNFKKKKPKLIAVVDEDNCTGCQVCVPFCPVDCIEPVEVEKYVELEPISFNATMFANILSANKECTNASLKISKAGLSKINFDVDEYKSEYYLVATQQVS